MSRDALICRRPDLAVHVPPDFEAFVPQAQWTVFRDAIQAVRTTGAPFAIGGGLAISFYTGLWRNTKDLDLYILRESREAVVAAISQVGMTDYFEKAPYDRAWIHRGWRDEAIVDVIWALANGLADVDEEWLECGAVARFGDEELPLVAPEEMFWSKMHVVQRDRCDWPDLVNLVFAAGPVLDWGRLLERVAPDEEPVAAVLALFAWLAPARARELPTWLWPRLGLRTSGEGPARDDRRIALLDSRPWFTPVEPIRAETARAPRGRRRAARR